MVGVFVFACGYVLGALSLLLLIGLFGPKGRIG